MRKLAGIMMLPMILSCVACSPKTPLETPMETPSAVPTATSEIAPHQELTTQKASFEIVQTSFIAFE